MNFPFESTIVTTVDDHTLMLPPLVGEVTDETMKQLVRALLPSSHEKILDMSLVALTAISLNAVSFNSQNHNAPILVRLMIPLTERVNIELSEYAPGKLALVPNDGVYGDTYSIDIDIESYDATFITERGAKPRIHKTKVRDYQRTGTLNIGHYNSPIPSRTPDGLVVNRASFTVLQDIHGEQFALEGAKDIDGHRPYGKAAVHHCIDGSSELSLEMEEEIPFLTSARYLNLDSEILISTTGDTLPLQLINDRGGITRTECLRNLRDIKLVGYIL